MKRTLLCALLALLAFGACKKATPETAVVGSGSGSGSGSGAGSGSGSATTTVGSGSGSAGAGSGSAGFSTMITPDGIGAITAKTVPATIASLFPGLDAENDVQESESSKVEYIKLSKAKKLMISAVVDHYVDEKAVFKVIVTDRMFATPTGIHVASTVLELAAKHPDTKCLYEKYDATADVEGVDRLLFCAAASLPRLSFQLDPATMRGKPGDVGLNVLALQPITEIVWLPGAKISVPPGSLGTITATTVGPITSTTPTTVEAIKQLLPSLDVATEVDSAEGEEFTVIMVARGKDNPVLKIGVDKPVKPVAYVTIYDRGFATASGVTVGTTVRDLATKEKGVTCSFAETEESELTCAATSQPNLAFQIALGNFTAKDGASIPIKKIGQRKIQQIHWRAK